MPLTVIRRLYYLPFIFELAHGNCFDERGKCTAVFLYNKVKTITIMNTNNQEVSHELTPEIDLLSKFMGQKTLTEVKAPLAKVLTRLFERKPVTCQYCDNGNEGLILMTGNGICLTLSIKDLEGGKV